MKQIHVPTISVYNFLTRFIRKLPYPVALSMVLISLFCSSCFRHFYSANTNNHIDSATLVKLINAQKYFILHETSHNRQYALNNIRLTDETLTAYTGPLLPKHSLHEHPEQTSPNVFHVRDKKIVLYEVHMYSSITGSDSTQVHIPLKDFTRVDIYELDTSRTSNARVVSIIGIAVTTGLIVAAFASAAEASKEAADQAAQESAQQMHCSPQVYLVNDKKFAVQGTLYSGAIAASLQRTDYMPLILKNHSGNKVCLTIKGKDEEDVMLNQINLMQVTHKETDHVLIDRQGEVLLYGEPVKAVQALIGNDQDIRSTIAERDGVKYSFTNQTGEGNSSDILLSFRKPTQATNGKLIVNAKNSNWSYYLFNQFKSLYGDFYPSLILKKDKADPSQVIRCELDQYMPLLVSVKYKGSWKFVDYFPTAGVTGCRDLIMNLNLEDFKDSSDIQVRLQTTYMFWDIDYAAMDFSTNEAYHDEIIAADKASLVNTNNESVSVDAENQHSNVFIKGPLRLDLEFTIDSSVTKGMINSYFLVAKGYYHDNSRYEGKARFSELSRFSGKGAFDKYSREKFDFLLHAIKDNENLVTNSSK
jgi:hypothetical protein